jgi:hypothetical protein
MTAGAVLPPVPPVLLSARVPALALAPTKAALASA